MGLQQTFRLIFLCSYDLTDAKCGPEGKGYEIQVDTDLANKLRPAWNCALFALKIANVAGKVLAHVDVMSVAKAIAGKGGKASSFQDITSELLMTELADNLLRKDDDNSFEAMEETLSQKFESAVAATGKAYRVLHRIIREIDPYLNKIPMSRVKDLEGQYRWVKNDNVEKWAKSTSESRRFKMVAQEEMMKKEKIDKLEIDDVEESKTMGLIDEKRCETAQRIAEIEKKKAEAERMAKKEQQKVEILSKQADARRRELERLEKDMANAREEMDVMSRQLELVKLDGEEDISFVIEESSEDSFLFQKKELELDMQLKMEKMILLEQDTQIKIQSLTACEKEMIKRKKIMDHILKKLGQADKAVVAIKSSVNDVLLTATRLMNTLQGQQTNLEVTIKSNLFLTYRPLLFSLVRYVFTRFSAHP